MCRPCLSPEYNLWEGLFIDGRQVPARPNSCFECPFRGDCSTVSTPIANDSSLVNLATSVNATKDTFGVESTPGEVTLYSCPAGYCCQDNVCPLQSCAGNRDPSTLMCGGCKSGFSLAIDSPNCVPSEKCGREPAYWALQALQWLLWGCLWTYQAWSGATDTSHEEGYTVDEREEGESSACDQNSAKRGKKKLKFLQVLIRPEMLSRYKDEDPGAYR